MTVQKNRCRFHTLTPGKPLHVLLRTQVSVLKSLCHKGCASVRNGECLRNLQYFLLFCAHFIRCFFPQHILHIICRGPQENHSLSCVVTASVVCGDPGTRLCNIRYLSGFVCDKSWLPTTGLHSSAGFTVLLLQNSNHEWQTHGPQEVPGCVPQSSAHA